MKELKGIRGLKVKLIILQFSLLLLLITLSFMLISNGQIENKPLVYKYELIATTKADTTIRPEEGIQVNSITEFEVSVVFLFDKETCVEIVQNILTQQTINPTDIWLRDNLGKEYSPIIKGHSITNPSINVTISPFTTYKLTLHYVEQQNLSITDGMYLGWRYTSEPKSIPLTVISRIPVNYTLLDNDSVNKTSDAKYTNIIWDFPEGETPSGFITYVPFPVERTIRSLKMIADIPAFGSDSSVKQTIEIIYDVQTDPMLWNISLHNINIPFPAKSTSLLSTKVSDEKEEYTAITIMPNNNGFSEEGVYYVDYTNRTVRVYAKPSHEQNNNKQFHILVTYEIPRLTEPTNKTIPFYQPYRKTVGLVFLLNESAYWHLNMTGDFTIQVILPPQSEGIVTEEDGFVISPYGDNREMATRVYNSPTNVPNDEWIVTFDNIKLRDHVYTQEASCITLLIILAIAISLGKVNLKTKSEYLALASIVVLAISPFALSFVNFSSLYILHWGDLFPWILVIGQFILSIAIVRVMWHHYNKLKSDS